MKRRAFTLAEMLIVVGIIAVLVGFLLVATRKGSEAARQVTCASNLRQIAAALTSYAQDNEGRFPGGGEAGFAMVEDWLYWEDPPDVSRPVNRSPIVKYLNKADAATILRCPSDEITSRPRVVRTKPCRYSYSFNSLFASTRKPPARPVPNPPPLLRASAIVEPNRKIMVIDEAEATIDDASWNPEVAPQQPGATLLANRHVKRTDDGPQQAQYAPPTRLDRSDKGNVAYADGHVEFVPRGDTWQRMYYDPRGSFAPDPTR